MWEKKYNYWDTEGEHKPYWRVLDPSKDNKGVTGGIFAMFLLLRSTARFFLAFFILRRGGGETVETLNPLPARQERGRLLRWQKLLRTLPLAWIFFAVAYALVPWADAFFKSYFLGGTFLPLAGWTVAAASLAHVSAALALAGGSLAAGGLSTVQAVFALILGSSLGVVSRVLRQNAGYYFGLFPPSMARSLLFWNLATILPLVGLSLLLAALPLLL